MESFVEQYEQEMASLKAIIASGDDRARFAAEIQMRDLEFLLNQAMEVEEKSNDYTVSSTSD